MNATSLGDQVKALYFEILDFLESCGGVYRVIDEVTCRNLIEALYAGRFFVRRNEAGEIVTFYDFWLVEPEDLPVIKTGGEPRAKDGGGVLFVVDFATREARRELTEKVRRGCLRRYGVAWFNRRRVPENFRYYPCRTGG